MQAATTLRCVREQAGLGLRELARRAGTSHATLHAYESGAVDPGVDTLDRIARSAGMLLEVQLLARPDGGDVAPRGRELAAALDLAAAFPARHAPTLRAPIWGRSR